MKKSSTLLLSALTGFAILHGSFAFAGWPIPGTNVCVGFGCSGPPIVGSEWLKKRWDEIGEGPSSAGRICSQVGFVTCKNIEFIKIYQALRAGSVVGIYDSVHGCVGFARTLNESGHEAARHIAHYHGVPLPEELVQANKDTIKQFSVAACEVLYDRKYDPQKLKTFDTPTGDAIYAPSQEAANMEERIRSLNETGQTGSSGVVAISNSDISDRGFVSVGNRAAPEYCLILQREERKDRGHVRVWECVTHNDMKWQFERTNDGFYRIRNRSAPGYCLILQREERKDRGHVRVWECVTHPDMHWRLEKDRYGFFRIRNQAAPEFCLILQKEERKATGHLRVWECVTHPDLHWRIE